MLEGKGSSEMNVVLFQPSNRTMDAAVLLVVQTHFISSNTHTTFFPASLDVVESLFVSWTGREE